MTSNAYHPLGNCSVYCQCQITKSHCAPFNGCMSSQNKVKKIHCPKELMCKTVHVSIRITYNYNSFLERQDKSMKLLSIQHEILQLQEYKGDTTECKIP